jgi:Na+/H+ antiporter NhaD/arsenite permease-like protein
MEQSIQQPNLWMALPFALLLGAIALGPLLFGHWWHKHYPKVSFALAAITLIYYLFILRAPLRVLEVGHEYISFIVLIGSLFVVSGGIHITVKGEATPATNVIFLFIGAVIANLIGTTGASMLLIRPWIRMNKYRITAHHIVFFIFIVSNIGGCLTPIGDPPLFIGFLKGIPFWWVFEHCLGAWVLGVGIMLIFFLLVDYWNYLKAPELIRKELAEPPDKWRFAGLNNIIFLGVILGSVFIEHPLFVREILMITAAVGSWFLTRKDIHEANHFNFEPIREVAILFVGIFGTMLPALDWLQLNAKGLGVRSPAFFFWSSGTLSSVLDNAPTYYSFLSAIFGLFVDPEIIKQVQAVIHSGTDPSTLTGPLADQVRGTLAALQQYHAPLLAAKTVDPEHIEIACLLGNTKLNNYIVAISVGAVFFGANTYIGNGPNFMVRSIAQHQKVHTPGFIGYIVKYTVPFMLPMLLIVWLTLFR